MAVVVVEVLVVVVVEVVVVVVEDVVVLEVVVVAVVLDVELVDVVVVLVLVVIHNDSEFFTTNIAQYSVDRTCSLSDAPYFNIKIPFSSQY